MVNDHVVEEGNYYDEILLQGFGFNFLHKDEKGMVREGFIEYPYLLKLMNLCS